jgi:ribosomal protection tetracycline resistance protein
LDKALNLGIVAHVDAGKTTLTERLLHAAGAIDQIGSVDEGSTVTDSLALERQRGITIRSAVASFTVGDVTVNLIDTPGHPDFIAEVERVLSVLDGAVLVISAVEGVQAQTRVLNRALRRLAVPTLIFVNKIDRVGAQDAAVLRAIAEKLDAPVVPLSTASGLGSRTARTIRRAGTDPGFVADLAELLTANDDALLRSYVDDALPYERLREALAVQTKQARVHPVYFGSAATGVGVAELMAGLVELLPTAIQDVAGPVSASVFKIERGRAGEKVVYVRMFRGTLVTRDRIGIGDERSVTVTAISVFERGTWVTRKAVAAGQIAQLWGLVGAQVGDHIGDGSASDPARHGSADQHYFAPPTLESVVVPAQGTDRVALHEALAQLAEQDPLIDLRQDDVRRELSISLYGEVQKDVVRETLAADYGLDVTFGDSTTICVERPAGTGSAVEFIGAPDNPFLGTVGLRLERARPGSGVTYRLGVELGSMPLAFFTAVEQTVHATLEQGLRGWQVIDCAITVTHSGYCPITSAGEFRNLTPLVVMAALRHAGTQVCEPVHHFRLDVPTDSLGVVLPEAARMRAIPSTAPEIRGSSAVIEGTVPAASVDRLAQRLPGLTSGEGVLESAFDRYEPVPRDVPSRPRTDHNPLDRMAYLQHVVRRT